MHVGGTLEEIAAAEAAVWRGEHPARPSCCSASRASSIPVARPAGKQTGWAYCHVPAGSTVDMTAAIEAQIERFAPGFRERILARHRDATARTLSGTTPTTSAAAIAGGVADLAQLFTRPVARLNPYTTPNPRIFICSASTPPGGGVHGMCGYHAAQTAIRRLKNHQVAPLA